MTQTAKSPGAHTLACVCCLPYAGGLQFMHPARYSVLCALHCSVVCKHTPFSPTRLAHQATASAELGDDSKGESGEPDESKRAAPATAECAPPRSVPIPGAVTGSRVAFCLDHVFSPEECAGLIALTEGEGEGERLGLSYGQALVNVGRGRQRVMRDVRTSDRCMVDDPELAEWIWQRIKK